MTVRLQLLAERFARLRRQDPDVAITGEWDAPALWQMGTPGASRPGAGERQPATLTGLRCPSAPACNYPGELQAPRRGGE